MQLERPVVDPFQYLEGDHRRLEQLFNRLDPRDPHAMEVRAELVNELEDALVTYSDLEQHVFYPMLKRSATLRAMTEEAKAQHVMLRATLEDLKSIDLDSDGWDEKIGDLRKTIEHHIEEEEEYLFPDARKRLSVDETRKLAAEMQAFLQEK